MDFPLVDYLDEAACYQKLLDLLHPDGLACPRCGERRRLTVHRRHRDPVLDYRCGECGRVFNAWTGTALHGSKSRPGPLLLILHGFSQGTPTAKMARELNHDRKHLLGLRHRLQEFARRHLDRNPLGDATVEADEMYQNAGEKRGPARRPGRSAAAARQPPAGPRDVRHRPPADRRGHRPGVGPGPAGGARLGHERGAG
jgi:transposase-like protein